jgi:hypothetical protein
MENAVTSLPAPVFIRIPVLLRHHASDVIDDRDYLNPGWERLDGMGNPTRLYSVNIKFETKFIVAFCLGNDVITNFFKWQPPLFSSLSDRPSSYLNDE